MLKMTDKESFLRGLEQWYNKWEKFLKKRFSLFQLESLNRRGPNNV